MYIMNTTILNSKPDEKCLYIYNQSALSREQGYEFTYTNPSTVSFFSFDPFLGKLFILWYSLSVARMQSDIIRLPQVVSFEQENNPLSN